MHTQCFSRTPFQMFAREKNTRNFVRAQTFKVYSVSYCVFPPCANLLLFFLIVCGVMESLVWFFSNITYICKFIYLPFQFQLIIAFVSYYVNEYPVWKQLIFDILQRLLDFVQFILRMFPQELCCLIHRASDKSECPALLINMYLVQFKETLLVSRFCFK